LFSWWKQKEIAGVHLRIVEMEKSFALERESLQRELGSTRAKSEELKSSFDDEIERANTNEARLQQIQQQLLVVQQERWQKQFV
jgi:hypothetical protein